jgi:capsular exopolysaccharide synthesis family protein
MRRPAVHRLFGMSNELGLADVVNERSDFHDVCQASPAKNVTVLTTGPIPDDPAELLAGDRFMGLLEALRDKFDYIILDCPPVLHVSDPTIIAPLVDAVLLVTSLDAGGMPKAKLCSRTLHASGAELVGLIVNRADVSSSSYVYSSEYASLNQYAPLAETGVGSSS